jgi:hypothetical protein
MSDESLFCLLAAAARQAQRDLTHPRADLAESAAGFLVWLFEWCDVDDLPAAMRRVRRCTVRKQ